MMLFYAGPSFLHATVREFVEFSVVVVVVVAFFSPFTDYF